MYLLHCWQKRFCWPLMTTIGVLEWSSQTLWRRWYSLQRLRSSLQPSTKHEDEDDGETSFSFLWWWSPVLHKGGDEDDTKIEGGSASCAALLPSFKSIRLNDSAPLRLLLLVLLEPTKAARSFSSFCWSSCSSFGSQAKSLKSHSISRGSCN